MAKKFHRHIQLLPVLWICVLATVLPVFASTSWNGNDTIVANALSYSWNGVLTNNFGKDSLSEEGAPNANVEHTIISSDEKGGSFKIKLTAKSSTYWEKEETCSTTYYRPGTTTTNVIITNTSSMPIKITDITVVGGIGTCTASTDDILKASTGTIELITTAAPLNETDKTSHTAEYEVQITFEYLGDLKLKADPSVYSAYSFTVDGTAYPVRDTAVVEKFPNGSEVTPSITIPEGYTFYGWRLSSGKLLGNGESFVLDTDTTIYPILLSAEDLAKPKVFQVGKTASAEKQFWFWEDAVIAAKASSEMIVLLMDYTLPNTMLNAGVTSTGGAYISGSDGNLTYIIPKGVTFLIPYDDAYTLCTTAPTVDNSIDVDAKYSNPTAYRTLTMGSGTNILVNGAMSLSGTHCANMCNGTFNGAPIGKLGFVDMQENSNITVSGGANLYVWGYITGGGTVTIKSNGTVYEDFQITDYRGGNATSGMKDNSYRVFPLSQYYVQNVQVPMTLEAGAAENGYMSVDVSYVGKQSATVPFIGSGAMFQIQSGSITKDYNEENDRLEIDVNGTLLMSNYKINIKVAILGNVELKTENYVLPVNGNITVNVASGSTLKIAQDISLYPGAIIDISPEARCELINGSSMYVYDVDQWGGYCGAGNRKICPVVYAPGRQKTRGESDLVDAKILVNGTLDATNGYIYTTTSGGNICSTGTGTAIIAAKSDATLYQAIQTRNAIEDSGWISIGISSAKLRNEDSSYVETSAATYRYAHHGSGGKWYPGEHVITPTVTPPDCTNSGSTLYSCVCGHSYTGDVQNALGHDMKAGTVTPPTCTAGGYTTYTCSRCGLTEQRDKTPAGSHSYSSAVTTEPSCTAEGIRTYTCGACGHSYTESIPKTDHNYESAKTEPSCTEEGYTTHTCTACGDSYTSDTIAALGHGWDDGIVTTEPTCTEAGVKTFTCGVCGETKTETISNTGHSYSVTETPATCEQDGSKVSVCSACGDEQVETLPATGHNWGDDGICKNDANHICTHSFNEESKCTICGYGCAHDFVAGEVVAPTCTAKGYTPYTCNICKKVEKRDETDMVDHSWIDATCTTPRTCSVCGAIDGEALGHTRGEAQKENEVLPTCVNGGSYDLVIRCTVCKEVLESTHCTTDATGSHTYGDWATTTEATYNSFAIQTRTCTVCQTATETQHPDSAKIGETSYSTLSLAVDAAAEGDTVTLLADISGDCVIRKTLTIEKNGHTANITAGDGYMADGDSAVTIWKLFKLAGTSVKVVDGLDIFFYVNSSDVSDGCYAKITRQKLTGTDYQTEVIEELPLIYSSSWESYSGGSMLRFSCNDIAAKEMTDKVTATIFDANGKQISAPLTESIEGYALRTLEKIPDKQNLRNAVITMVHYGAAAQTNFGYRTREEDHLANENLAEYLTGEESALVSVKPDSTYNTTYSGQYSLAGTSVTAGNYLHLNFYFDGIADIRSELTAHITYKDHYNRDREQTIAGSAFKNPPSGENYYGPCVEGIAMADGRAEITCTLKKGEETVATAVSSIESYIDQSENNADANLVNVCTSLLRFVDYVNAYFENPNV